MKLISGVLQLSAMDLINYVRCRHLTELSRAVALGQAKMPGWNDAALEALIQRGAEHEADYVRHLEKKGLTIARVKDKGPEAVVKAMEQGADAIVQARLTENQWVGYADILFKVKGSSKFGNWAYEVQDTKLSQNTRTATILQLCAYTELLAGLQGTVPECMHVVTPGKEFPSQQYRYAEFQAYYRLLKKNFEGVVERGPQTTYPQPVDYCGICRWWKQCDARRRDDDHLSLIAGIHLTQRNELERQAISTLEQYAQQPKPLPRAPRRGTIESYRSIHEQAKIQWQGRVSKKLLHKVLELQNGKGLFRLPAPSPGDIFLDIEGDPYFGQEGLEYLFGYTYYTPTGEQKHEQCWALDRLGEKKIFEQFMDFVTAHNSAHDDLHIYHYGAYEPAAIKRLAGRHATRAYEVDRLLRAERFINLHLVIKESLKASVERYSLKEIERFTPYKRAVDLKAASMARRDFESALELDELSALPPEVRKTLQGYNLDDCLAAQAVRDWLEEVRSRTNKKSSIIISRPTLKLGSAGVTHDSMRRGATALFEYLKNEIPEDPAMWTGEHQAKWLLACLIDYFRRERASAWWEYFRVHQELDYDELLMERKALTGLKFEGDTVIPPERLERFKEPPTVHRYSFVEQEVGIPVYSELHEVLGNVGRIGRVFDISIQDRTIDIHKERWGQYVNWHPEAVHVSEVVNAEQLQLSLHDVASQIILSGFADTTVFGAAKALLMKRGAVVNGGNTPLLAAGEDVLDGAVRIALQLNNSVLAIQGPPGSGKTHAGAHMILKLVQQGKKVGVTAVSHKVIRNLFDKVLALARSAKISIQLVHKARERSDTLPRGLEEVGSQKDAFEAMEAGKVLGGTVWLWAAEEPVGKLDYLFVDEAGQMSLAYVLAASRACKNLVLLGDPCQLQQPQRGAHPEEADVAALTHLLDGHKTIRDTHGLFLNITRRLHPDICRFTSELYYDGRLHALPDLENQELLGNSPFKGSGLCYVPVPHIANQVVSHEEVENIVKITRHLTGGNIQWRNAKKRKATLTLNDILIVAPFNAQVDALKEQLPGARIGTVDKFQGQEAPVVIYSLASSSAHDAPRGIGFLLDPHRMNVATSRARCMCILVASPHLFEVECRSIDQMRWVNGLCRFKELSRHVTPELIP